MTDPRGTNPLLHGEGHKLCPSGDEGRVIWSGEQEVERQGEIFWGEEYDMQRPKDKTGVTTILVSQDCPGLTFKAPHPGEALGKYRCRWSRGSWERREKPQEPSHAKRLRLYLGGS